MFFRDLANTRADICTPEFLENEAKKIVAENPSLFELEVLHYDQLLAKGMNLIAAVGQGKEKKVREKTTEKQMQKKLGIKTVGGENERIKIEVFRDFTLFLGSKILPRLILIKYKGQKLNAPASDSSASSASTSDSTSASTDSFQYAFVGKGITFDTGGLNMKPTNFIEEMYMDMG